MLQTKPVQSNVASKALRIVPMPRLAKYLLQHTEQRGSPNDDSEMRL